MNKGFPVSRVFCVTILIWAGYIQRMGENKTINGIMENKSKGRKRFND